MIKKILSLMRNNKEVRQSQSWGAVVEIRNGNPIYPDVNYAKLAQIGYKKNVYVYRCVNLIANTFSGITFNLYHKDGSDKDTEIESHPSLDLMKRPNEFQGETDFKKNLMAYLQISGNTYVESVSPSKSSPPRELFSIRPDLMKIVPGNRMNPILGYEYTLNGLKHLFPFEDIFHGKLFNPLEDPIIGYGQSPLEPALKSVTLVNESMDWNNSLLQNGACPSAILKMAGSLTDDQRELLKEEIEREWQGPENRGKVFLAEEGMEWEQVSLSPKELQILELLTLGAKQICITYGIDSSLISDGTNKTYSNFKESRSALYEDVLLPLADWFADDFLNAWLLPKFPGTENMYFSYSTDNIEALNEDRKYVYERNISAFDKGLISINEAREALGFSELQEDELVQLKGEEKNNEVEEAEEDNKKKDSSVRSLDSKGYINEIERQRKKWDEIVQVRVTNQFNKEELAMVEALQNSIPELALQRALDSIDDEAWIELYTSIYEDVMRDFATRTLDSMDKRASAGDIIASASGFIRNTVGKRVKDVLDTTKKRVSEAINNAIAEGENIVQAIKGLYTKDTPLRSRAISQTEVITAGNAGSRFAIEGIGDISIKKKWISVMDERTRESHRKINGQIRNINELYSNGLMYPGDPDGSSEETINCRCIESYSAEGG